jgi:hypothetical protein
MVLQPRTGYWVRVEDNTLENFTGGGLDIAADRVLTSWNKKVNCTGNETILQTDGHHDPRFIEGHELLWWAFDDVGVGDLTEEDKSDWNRNGTRRIQASTMTAASGVANLTPGHVFDESNSDYVELGDAIPELDVGNPWSISLWINPTTIDNDHRNVVSHARGAANLIHVGVKDPGDRLRFSVTDGTGKISESSNALTPGTTYHVMVTWDPTTRAPHVYIDGVLIDAGNNPINGTTSANFVVGGSTDKTAAYAYDGVVDDVRVYKGVLTLAHAVELYKGGAGDPNPLMVHLVN